ncbi:sulfate transporter [Blastomyces dermatitidis ER-3]|uniref:Sulfate transporter n=1 Tax=Ajellomyces dermatitidis (strain ER-3 / ATCC MYA-2586) TaxID=559297 RepID=A0ABP2F3I7_AJEDR|nr:sulfate transporter [Blastomyces dermatitidis ER-3]EEQ91456.1 sulfate transporter [Blastomyces dermatitidis ER-3]
MPLPFNLRPPKLPHSRHNRQTLRNQPLSELSGALGDLGTFLPLLTALAINNTVSLPATLLFSGLYNILTGLFFGIPLPVQPMKAIAAVAIAKHFTPGQIAAAGIFVGACILLFSVTGLLTWFARVVPTPVVKGIQVGAGLSLVISAGASLKSQLGWSGPSWGDNYIWMLVAFVALALTGIYRRVPYGLVVFVVGLGFAFVLLGTSPDQRLPSFGVWRPGVFTPVGDEWRVGIVDAGIGQIPLTTLNSIVAVVYLAGDLLPEVQTPSTTAIGLSVAGMNLLGCWFGAMPVCHGSGGLAAQYRFGARSGASIILLGAFKLIIGLFFGNTLVGLLQRFPKSFLGVMVIAAGLELASVGESLNTSRAWDMVKHPGSGNASGLRLPGSGLNEAEKKQRWTVMMVTVGMLVAFKNDGIGFLAGMVCHWTYKLPALIEEIQRRYGEGRIRLPGSGRGRGSF